MAELCPGLLDPMRNRVTGWGHPRRRHPHQQTLRARRPRLPSRPEGFTVADLVIKIRPRLHHPPGRLPPTQTPRCTSWSIPAHLAAIRCPPSARSAPHPVRTRHRPHPHRFASPTGPGRLPKTHTSTARDYQKLRAGMRTPVCRSHDQHCRINKKLSIRLRKRL